MTLTYSDLGWSTAFARQYDLSADDGLTAARVAEVHRDRISALTPGDTHSLTTPPNSPTGDYAVGDWVLFDRNNQITQTLDRQTELSRRAAGSDARVQLIAANVDTLFITTSCNDDFNTARLERYLTLARDSGAYPVVILTKSDLAKDPDSYTRQAEALAPMLTVLTLNALDADAMDQVAAWCPKGQTAALVGSSGTGKSTLMNGLTRTHSDTAGIREDDARGRHTTTARSLRQMTNGGWLIDTPGMRALRLHDVADGIDSLFADISDLARQCRFNDCHHETEPGCAIQAALANGDIDADRLLRWRKLSLEDARHTSTIAETRARDKSFGKMIKRIQSDTKSRKR